MSHWKKKITQFSLAGKGSIIYKSGRQSPKIGYVGPEIVLSPPAFNYDNAPTGQIEVREPSGTGAVGEIQGGYYDNR